MTMTDERSEHWQYLTQQRKEAADLALASYQRYGTDASRGFYIIQLSLFFIAEATLAAYKTAEKPLDCGVAS